MHDERGRNRFESEKKSDVPMQQVFLQGPNPRASQIYNTALTHLISLIIKPVNVVTANRERKRPSMKERSLSA